MLEIFVLLYSESDCNPQDLTRPPNFSFSFYKIYTTNVSYFNSIRFDEVYNSMLPSVVQNQRPKNGKRIPVCLKNLFLINRRTNLALEIPDSVSFVFPSTSGFFWYKSFPFIVHFGYVCQYFELKKI